MEQNRRGRITPLGVLGTDINFARSRPTDNGYKIVLASARPISIFESYQGTRTMQYKFEIVLLDLDKEGTGSGTLIVAAQLNFNDDGALVIERYGMNPIELLNVEPLR